MIRKILQLSEIAPHWQSSLARTVDYSSAKKLCTLLINAGFEAYIIGGAVRDVLLERTPKDIDIVTNAQPEQILALKGPKKAFYKDTAQAYGITRVHLHEQMLEVATFRKDIGAHRGRKQTEIAFATLKEDIQRRDFTINALALDLIKKHIIDEVDGFTDIQNKIIRFIGDPKQRIQEDPLRILRAIRLKNALDFHFDPTTKAAISAAIQNDIVPKIAIDRLRQEITLMLQGPSPSDALRDLDNFSILARILPEVTAGKNIQQPTKYHAEGDVWQHQLRILDALPPHPSLRLAWAALLHDIGKSRTQSTDGENITFHNHYSIGAEMTKATLQRLQFSKKDIRDITWIIYHHMNIDDLPNMRPHKQHEMLSHPAFSDLLALHRADATASWPGHKRQNPPEFPEIEKLWVSYQEDLKHPPPSLKKDLGIDGQWLIDHFAIPRGPKLGKTLHSLEEYYYETGDKNLQHYFNKAKHLLESIEQ